MNTGIIISAVITRVVSIGAFVSGVVPSVGIAVSGTSLLISFAVAITQKSFKKYTVMQAIAYPMSFHRQCKT